MSLTGVSRSLPALAIQANHCDIVALLLDAGASEFSLNVYNDSAVYAAVYNRQLSVLKLLVSRGCDCNYQSEIAIRILSTWNPEPCF